MGFKGERIDWESYFSLYNIEYEILLNALEKIFSQEKACRLKDLIQPQVFHKLNPNLVAKLVDRGLLKRIHRGGEYYTVTTRGIAAFLSVVKHVYEILDELRESDYLTIAEKVANRVFLGGIYRVREVHNKLVKRTLDLLSLIGVIESKNNKYIVVDYDKRVKALAFFLRKISTLTTIRNIEELVHIACSSLLIPIDYENQVLQHIMSYGAVIGEKDPREALLDLLFKTRNVAYENLKRGKLVEAAAYEAMGLEIMRIIEKMGLMDEKNLKDMKSKFLFHFYVIMGEFLYNNLLFDLAKTMYHWAVQVAHENPVLAKEAKKVNAKYLLSLARSLAEKGRYEEAISRLQELVGYYKSTGSMRESLIAEALINEYMAELEIRKHKPCNSYRTLLSAVSVYNELGGEYKSRAEALRVKALISQAECYITNKKDINKAIKILEKAKEKAVEILSPHLRNVVESILHELIASQKVVEEKYSEAAKEYMESAKYYSTRGNNYRSLLNQARGYKFKGYSQILENKLREALENFIEAHTNYYKLLKQVIRKYYKTGKLNYYVLNESIKGYYDTNTLIHALKIILDTNLDIRKEIHIITQSLVEAGRIKEQKILATIIDLLNNNKIDEAKMFLRQIINNDDMPPRIKIFAHALSKIVDNINNTNTYISNI
ncbi:hypothetical protein Smar_0394 [Staphylothermus marinus F1]|uniref:Tetratricopeptide repeat protein n=1 Tax=Staphylothermus marinus (strain ATCC 43588 / DSM 3639 / JCM 9404 / F1) TaxID=399550 RepID=A3DLJ6_STAMF|nr:hypothetical protein [Staphylothermus marinus]ABN69506.1 hypothetical protein Smar_0394 [Staphylothermus marinus F1]